MFDHDHPDNVVSFAAGFRIGDEDERVEILLRILPCRGYDKGRTYVRIGESSSLRRRSAVR